MLDCLEEQSLAKNTVVIYSSNQGWYDKRWMYEESRDADSSHYYQYYEYLGYHCVERHYGVRTKRYKLIHFYNREEWELPDMETDPMEMNSVYDDAYSETVTELKAELARLREQYAVPKDERPTGPCIPNERSAPIPQQ